MSVAYRSPRGRSPSLQSYLPRTSAVLGARTSGDRRLLTETPERAGGGQLPQLRTILDDAVRLPARTAAATLRHAGQWGRSRDGGGRGGGGGGGRGRGGGGFGAEEMLKYMARPSGVLPRTILKFRCAQRASPAFLT